jgi:hypothetical protein
MVKQILENPSTPNIVIAKKKKTPNPWKLDINKLRSSHSIKNFTNKGKPRKISKADHTSPERRGAKTDKPPKAGNILVP